MLVPVFQHSFEGAAHDIVEVDQAVLVALGRNGVAVFRNGNLVRNLDCDAEHLVPSDDGRSVLVVSPFYDPPSHFPLRRLDPPEEPWWRDIYRLEFPWLRVEKLGRVSLQDWARTFDGSKWLVFEGDDLRLLRLSGSFGIEREFRTCCPVKIERIDDGFWVELSSLGASHYETFSLELELLDEGDLPHPPICFPPETFSCVSRSPRTLCPVIAVRAAGLPVTLDREGGKIHHEILGVDRVITQEGQILTKLPAPAQEMEAEGERLLVWAPFEGGLKFYFICLKKAQVREEFFIPNARWAQARIVGPRLCLNTDSGEVRILLDLLVSESKGCA